MKTYSAKPADVVRAWYVLDASQIPVGRLATQAAKLLIGKDKPQFTKHIDCGDYVIVINADNLVVTGKKADQKMFYRHSGFPGGLTEVTQRQQMEKDSTKVVKNAIRGMLPVNKLRAERLNRLKIYGGDQHGHEAQKPQLLNLKEAK